MDGQSPPRTNQQGGKGARTSSTDPAFIENFYKASRLHFIGTWKDRFQNLIDSLPPLPPVPKTPASGGRIILHCDMDAFFASVAIRSRPHLASKPVAVCWSGANGNFSEISSCNYIARGFGVKAGMFIRQARELCATIETVPFEFDQYTTTAFNMYRIFFDATPHVQGISVDEAYLDVTGTAMLRELGPGGLAAALRRAVFEKTQCTCSVGIGGSRLLARLATREAKPDGAFHLKPDALDGFMDNLPVRQLPTVGGALAAKLHAQFGARTERCGGVRALSAAQLEQCCGASTGRMLREFSRGVDSRKVHGTGLGVHLGRSAVTCVLCAVRLVAF
jgi:DNA repair protein REV1